MKCSHFVIGGETISENCSFCTNHDDDEDHIDYNDDSDYYVSYDDVVQWW